MDYSQLFDQAGRQYNIDPALLRAQMQVESGGNPNAMSSQGAQGLMQVIPATQKTLGITDPNDPAQSINGAAKLMAENLDRYGNVADAVRAYHGGTDQANWGPKTQAYAQKVMSGYGGQAQQQETQKMVTAAAQQPDDLTNDFMAPKAKGAAAPAQDDLLNDFLPPTAKAPVASVAGQPAQVPATAPPEAQSTAGGVAGRWIDNGIGALQDVGAGTIEGLKRGVDTPAEYLTKWAGGDYDAQVAADKARRAAYDATNPGYLGFVSRLGGEIAGPAGELGVAGKMARFGGNALLGGLRATEAGSAVAPTLQAAGKFAAGDGGILSRMLNASGQGAAGAALTSGGGNPTPLSDQIELGAALGGALPIAGSLLRGAGAVGSKVVQGVRLLNGSGQDAAISDLVGGAAQKAAPELANLPKGATVEQIGQAASTAPKSAGGSSVAGSNALEDILSGKATGAKVGSDFTEYVPGSKPTLAQATGNSGIAELERAAISQNSAPFTALEQANNNARGNFLQQIRGTPESVSELAAQREQNAIPLLKTALEGAQPINANPVVSQIDSILASPDGKRGAVRSAMSKVMDNLSDANGNLETDAAQIYGVRKAINDQLEKVAGKDNSEAQQATSQLLQVKQALDSSLEKGAPGFSNYLKTYSDMSRPIEAQQFLQGKDLTDATSSQFSLNKMKNLMNTIQKMQSSPGANAAKSISPEQMQGLQALHMDLQRQANSMLGTGKNSATMQLINGNNLLNGATGNGLVSALAPHAIGSALGFSLGGPLGAAVGGGIGHVAGNSMANLAATRSAELNSKLIDVLLGHGGADSLNMLMPKAQRGASGLTDLANRSGSGSGAAGATGNNK